MPLPREDPSDRPADRATSDLSDGTGLLVLTGDRVGAITRFDSSVLRWFGLPRAFPG